MDVHKELGCETFIMSRYGWRNWLQGLEMAVKRLAGIVFHCQVSGLTTFVRNMSLICGLLWRFPGHCRMISRAVLNGLLNGCVKWEKFNPQITQIDAD